MNMLKENVPKHMIPNGGSLDGDFDPMGSQSVKKVTLKKQIQVNWRILYCQCLKQPTPKKNIWSMGFSGIPQGHGTPENGKRDPYHSHIFKDSCGSGMGP